MADSAARQPEPDRAGPPTVWMFPGQGSQKVGMGRELLEHSPAARRILDRAERLLGWPVAQLCTQGPEQELTLTERLQPALFTISMASLAALQAAGAQPPLAAMGHSLGEYAALVAAEALSFEDALRAVAERGRLMGQALPAGQGGMAAVIGLEGEAVAEVCRAQVQQDGLVLAVANLNSPGQVVISGHTAAIDAAEPALRRAGAKGIIRLKVSAPFHCELMQPAADGLADLLAGISISAPRFPVLSNVTGQPHRAAEDIRRLLVEQVVRPVRWTACVRWSLEAGAARFLEIGPGKVLAGLLRRIDRRAKALGVGDPRGVAAAVAPVDGEDAG